MSKAYSNKALPAGTVIREWRLEDVLGVGGFGIVYRGRGIYFGELVAIKEYFPSSISERDAEDTVVPIGSDVEEVHALGLKKFVEEAKLLWNLSTPSRHPNIVSVRSLFEVHGTAYMVMDFEDGMSLSKLLKEGRRFNERSLWNIVQPIAAGLDRAHRVGVLHRDIKPPNILITEDNRPVLIDFGSARFEAAEATSTTVTFHTPPYAAIEQYVKTYPQGPWTDIYAMAVVLYECVTGEKPPEVLERLHGGLGQPLAEGHWPGFGKRFLQAIDAGMTIRPAERPQSIRAWLALFGKKDVEAETDTDESPTRFFSHEVAAEEIVPVAPPAPGFDSKVAIETQVPTDPGEVQFKRAGEETHITEKRKKDAVLANGAKSETTDKGEPAPPIATTDAVVPVPPKKTDAALGSPKMPPTARPAPSKRLLVGAGAAALLVAAATGAIMFGKGNSDGGAASSPNSQSAGAVATPVAGSDVSQLASAARSLADDGRNAGVPEAAVNGLVAAGDQLDQQSRALQPLLNDPKQTAAATARSDEMKGVATSANMAFANALLRDAEATAQKLAFNVPSTSPSGARLQSALSSLRAIVQTPVNGIDPDLSLTVARKALASSQAFAATLPAAFGQQTATKRAAESLAQSSKKTPSSVTPRAVEHPMEVAPMVTAPAAATIGVSPAKMGQFGAIIGSSRSLAMQVIRMGDRDPQAKANATLAKNYDAYLRTLQDSMRGAKADRDADRLIKQANQTRAYLVFLNKQSSK